MAKSDCTPLIGRRHRVYSCSEFSTSRRRIAVLVLSRKPGEKIHIGEHITITVIEVQGGRIRLGVEAPQDVDVWRSELSEGRKRSQKRTDCTEYSV
jgi:carbon storage regulator